ncbi:hypothetical protein PP651_gp54 [Aeromonas phage ZPAH14]|uniref:Uncharacterized protein n=1 Tax=Aeromonas phage ZPAH14 TaxID=2924887 RepID=A0AAE9KI90_9CAUD|nr:hypothetical protein PP651_gp54 [Aeromonas phage ZPAH14]UOT58025.1 hypothetical protein [Aeromonas phage ZPAH14]
MEKQVILEIVEHNAARVGLYTGLRWIAHPNNPNQRYHASRLVKMHCDDGEWRPGVIYSDGLTTYCRRADDFAKFSEVER